MMLFSVTDTFHHRNIIERRYLYCRWMELRKIVLYLTRAVDRLLRINIDRNDLDTISDKIFN